MSYGMVAATVTSNPIAGLTDLQQDLVDDALGFLKASMAIALK